MVKARFVDDLPSLASNDVWTGNFEISLMHGWEWEKVNTVHGLLDALKQRFETNGWTSNGGAQDAIASTIRNWIVYGLVHHVIGEYDSGIKILRQTVEFLDLGGQRWKFVPTEECGEIFEPSFIRRVRRLYLGVPESVGTY